MTQITIIIPVYNTGMYLDRCIQSVICQSFSEWQAILIDDGSTDESGVKCDKWQHKDSRIIVIHKPNGGLSSARNVGYSMVNTPFFTFLDSDDFLSQDWLNDLYCQAISNDADIVMGGFTRVNDISSLYKYPLNSELPIYRKFSHDEILDYCILPLFGKATNTKIPLYFSSVCDKLFRTSFVGDLSFVSERKIVSEDNLFCIQLYMRFPKFVFAPNFGYQYYLNKSSLTSSYGYHNLNGFINYFSELDRLSTSVKCRENIKQLIGIQTFYRFTSTFITKNPFLNIKAIYNVITKHDFKSLILNVPRRKTLSENTLLYFYKNNMPLLACILLGLYWLFKKTFRRGYIKPDYGL